MSRTTDAVLNHSPAPWTVREGPFGHTFIECQSGHTVAGIALSCDGPQPAANAALISAAPDLYEAAKGITDMAEAGIGADDDCVYILSKQRLDGVRAALAKAEGRS